MAKINSVESSLDGVIGAIGLFSRRVYGIHELDKPTSKDAEELKHIFTLVVGAREKLREVREQL